MSIEENIDNYHYTDHIREHDIASLDPNKTIFLIFQTHSSRHLLFESKSMKPVQSIQISAHLKLEDVRQSLYTTVDRSNNTVAK